MAFQTENYSLENLIQSLNKKQRVKYLYFWGHRPSADGSVSKSCFSQWWNSSFIVDGNRFPTAEHWMMAQKALLFNDQDIFMQILLAKSPAEAKQLGRKVARFDQTIWEENAFKIVVEGNYHKFSQNPELKAFLIGTNDRVLVEASPVDKIWGIGMAENDPNIGNPRQWNGLNLLGFALMEVRDQLLQG